MPVAYIPRTRDLYSDFIPYRWVENDDLPAFTALPKPIAECKVALISSGGIMYRDQPRFHREDASYRRIPKNATRDDLSIWHSAIQLATRSAIPTACFHSNGSVNSKPAA